MATTDTLTYTYVRHTPKGRLSDSTQVEDMELAQKVLGDLVFCAQLSRGILARLASDDPNTVYTGLQSVYKFEDKIGYLGGWEQFLASKQAPAEPDVLRDDHHAVGVTPPKHRASFLDQEHQAHVDATFEEARAMANEHSDVLTPGILRGLQSRKLLDVQKALIKAKDALKKQAKAEERAELIRLNPLHFAQEEAQVLGRDVNDAMFRIADVAERETYARFYHDLTVAWNDPELLKLWIDQTKELLAPPVVEPAPLLPPVTTGVKVGDLDWKEGVGETGPPNPQGIGIQPRGRVVATAGKNKRAQKGGGVSTRPGRTGKKQEQHAKK